MIDRLRAKSLFFTLVTSFLLTSAVNAQANGNIDDRFGDAMAPAYIKYYEADTEHQITVNPFLQVGNKDNPIVLDPKEGYIWVIDKAGNFCIGPEATSPWGKKYENGYIRPEDGKPKKKGDKEEYGHVSLVGGEVGRIGGELAMENGVWIMNNKSGRYNYFAKNRTEKQLKEAGEYLKSIAPQVTELKYEWLDGYYPPKKATMKSMEDIEYHDNIDLKYAWNGESKELGKDFVAKTPYITWNNKVKFQELFYVDTKDRYLKSKGIIIRVRENISAPEKSKITLKTRSDSLDTLIGLPKVKKGEIDYFRGKANYSFSKDYEYNPYAGEIVFEKATAMDAVNHIRDHDWKAYTIIVNMLRGGEKNILKTATARASSYKGWINEGPFKGQEIAIQLWKVSGEKTPYVFEIGFDGETKDIPELDKKSAWLMEKLKNSGVLAKEGSSKTEATFDKTGTFKEVAHSPVVPEPKAVSYPALTGFKALNVDGTINVTTTTTKVKVMEEEGIEGSLVQSLFNDKPLAVKLLGCTGKESIVKAKIIGLKDGSLVAIKADSVLDNPKSLTAMRAVLANRLQAINTVGEAHIDYLKKHVKKEVGTRETRLYNWPGYSKLQ